MIHKATKADIPQIKKLIDQAAAQGKVLARSLEELTEVVSNFCVCIKDNEIVGCCSLEIYNQKLAEIRSLVVTHEHRRQGIGKELVSYCLEEAKNKHIYEVLTITDKDAFFERMGFSKCLNGQYPMFLRP
ncbi:MAG: hypothetical protein RI947_447 [Candidatus Parcubacteria bacterium]|jgi:amino-acid N-acetyltransferase